MKIITVKIFTVAGLAGLLAGCESPGGGPNYTGSGALIGGASGAALGALSARGAPGAGALIGGTAGLVVGGLIGNSMDQQADARQQYTPPPPAPNAYAPAPSAPPTVQPPSIADIKAMTRAGVGDDIIIGQINNSYAVYHLDADALIDLHNAGVSQKVIARMINTASTVAPQAPPVAPPVPQQVVVAPGTGYVWVGGEWAWNGRSWIWVSGRWILPPHRYQVWVPAHWVRGPYGWRRVGGYWR